MKVLNWNVQDVNSGGIMSKEYIWNLKDLENIKKNGLKVFSCFSCGGGSSMGYKLAGFEVIGNNEIDPKMNSMYIKNNKPQYNFNCDIRDIVNQDLPEIFYNIDILDGSPPCSVFSTAGLREKGWNKEKVFREGQEKQRLDDLFIHFLNFADKIKPKVIIAENVKGLIQKRAKGYVNEIINKFNEIGYKVQLFLLNSANMGVPQSRPRVFFIGSRKDLNLPDLKLHFNEPIVPYGEFKDSEFKLVNKDSKTYYMWSQREKFDSSLEKVSVRLHGRKKLFSSLLIYDHRVVGTITSAGYFLRFDVPGTLSNKDLITIQTFPQDYDFCGHNVQYVCGMSVPPIMMKKIAEQVYFQILRGDTTE